MQDLILISHMGNPWTFIRGTFPTWQSARRAMLDEFRTAYGDSAEITFLPDEMCVLVQSRQYDYSFALEPEGKAVELFARTCDITKEPMNAGYIFGDGEFYAKTKENADLIARTHYNAKDFDDLHERDEDFAYYTDWEDPSEYLYLRIDGKLYEMEQMLYDLTQIS